MTVNSIINNFVKEYTSYSTPKKEPMAKTKYPTVVNREREKGEHKNNTYSFTWPGAMRGWGSITRAMPGDEVWLHNAAIKKAVQTENENEY